MRAAILLLLISFSAARAGEISAPMEAVAVVLNDLTKEIREPCVIAVALSEAQVNRLNEILLMRPFKIIPENSIAAYVKKNRIKRQEIPLYYIEQSKDIRGQTTMIGWLHVSDLAGTLDRFYLKKSGDKWRLKKKEYYSIF